MRELGHRGGKARRAGVVEQLPAAERESLRHYLRASLDHEKIKAAIEQSLAGGNESARVAAVKFLADLELYRGEQEEDRERDWQKATLGARDKLAELIRGRATRAIQRRGSSELAQELRAAAAELFTPEAERKLSELTGVQFVEVDAETVAAGLLELGLVKSSDATDAKVEARAKLLAQQLRDAANELFTPEAERELAELLGLSWPVEHTIDVDSLRRTVRELGLDSGIPTADLVPRARVEQLAEELAQERLQALKQEHGIPA
jgi:hypothetical protein